MRHIPVYRARRLSKGQSPAGPRVADVVAYTQVDDEDYDRLMDHRWFLSTRPTSTCQYAVWLENTPSGKRIAHRMHREILGCATDREVDHADGDGLNNTRANLRVCSRAENMRNRRRFASNRSGVKGVYYVRGRANPWRVQLRVDGRKIEGGSFATLDAARLAYDAAAKRYHGEFARLNAA